MWQARAMPRRSESAFDRVVRRLGRRNWPIVVSAVYVALGLVYFFRWGAVGQHTQALWISPQDLWITYFSSSQLAHGHFGAIYQGNVSFVEFPGILLLLAPFGALSNSFHTAVLEITKGGPVPAVGFAARAQNVPFLNAQELHFHGTTYVTHPQWVAVVDPYALLLSCTALFACDALAERLQVSRPRRAILCAAEAVLLWNVTVWWGHPEDAVAVALAVYALISAMDRRFTKAGWLFGAAIAFQPLVLLMLPVLLGLAGKERSVGLALRSVTPTAVLIAFPLIANPDSTFHALLDQPSSPAVNHATPWTALSPVLVRHPVLTVAAGPVRAIALLLAVGLGIWVYRRWRERPELLAWACAAALALRSYTESVMTDYYSWAALAVGLIVACRASQRRFALAIFLAVATSILGQWKLGWFPWWVIQVVGLTLFLAVISRPAQLAMAKPRAQRDRTRAAVGQQSRARSDPTGRDDRATKSRAPTASQSRSRAGTAKKPTQVSRSKKKRSRHR